jgi:E3 ubiquitin-protein ligase SIAH1
MLVDHFKAVHGTWPCATMVRASTTDEDEDEYKFIVSLHDGFNFLVADCPTDGVLYLFLLNVVRQPHGCAISVLCIHPDNEDLRGMEMQCKLSYSAKSRRGDGCQVIKHFQESTFTVECTDLSDGLPSPDECFQFVVPEPVLTVSDTIVVVGRISIF